MIDLTLDYIKERELLLKEIEKLREERNQLRKVLLDVLAKEYVADCTRSTKEKD